METWNQICNMRTTLLHLQFIYCTLSQKIENQKIFTDRAHKDRLIQYADLHEEYIKLQSSNFKKILIVKLQSCLSAYAKDEQIWKCLDSFIKYTKMMEEEMVQNIGKLYIGKNVLFDLEKVEKQLANIFQKMETFNSSEKEQIESYNKRVNEIEDIRKVFTEFLSEVKIFYETLKPIYPKYVEKMLNKKELQVQKQISDLKSSLLA